MKKINLFKLAFLLALSCSTFFASAKDVYLSADGSDDTGKGTLAEPYKTFFKSIGAVANGDRVLVIGTVDITAEVGQSVGLIQSGVADAKITIEGYNNGQIIGSNAKRLLLTRAGQVITLKNLTVSISSTFTGNGGVIICDGGSLVCDNVVFDGNSATANGGVIYVNNLGAAAKLSCKNTVFKNNFSSNGQGGVLFVLQSQQTGGSEYSFENCAFISNTCAGGGGGVGGGAVHLRLPDAKSVVNFVNTTFANNTSGGGAGSAIHAYSANNTEGNEAELNIVNCTFTENTSTRTDNSGGAVSINTYQSGGFYDSKVNVYNSIIEGNTIAGGYYDLVYTTAPKAGTLKVYNSLVGRVYNVPADATSQIGYASNAASLRARLSTFNATTNSYTPQECSAAIKIGAKTYLSAFGITYDQLNQTRSFLDDRCDAGAIETDLAYVLPGIYVSETGNDATGNGSFCAPFATLNKALTSHTSGTVIYIIGTITIGTATGTVADGFAIPGTSIVTIKGVTGTTPKLLMDGTSRAVSLTGNAVCNLKNLTIQGSGTARAGDAGFAILNGGSLTADSCTFQQFIQSGTGGVFRVNSLSATYPLVSFTNSVFKNNSAQSGGCIHVQGLIGGAKVYFENCAFVNNGATTGNGGAVIWLRSGTDTSVIYPEVTFVNSTITGSTGNHAISLYSGTPVLNIINSTIKDNLVRGIWAFSYLADARINIYNSIIEGNTTSDFYLQSQDASVIGAVNINNSFINATNYTGGYTKPAGYTSTTQLLDAYDATTYSFTPKSGSLAINYGDKQYLNALDINYDQLGNQRYFVNDKVDVGAIETDRSLTNTWLGLTNTWNEATNWDLRVPTAKDAVIIPAGKSNYPELATDVTVDALTLEPATAIDLGASKLSAGSIVAQTLIDATKWYSIGFPFAINEVYSEQFEEQLTAGTNYWLKSYTGNGFSPTTAIEANTGYIIQLPAGESTDSYTEPTGITYTSGEVTDLEAGTLSFNSTYTLQPNPTLAPYSIDASELEEANQYVYQLNLTENEYQLVTGATILAPFESVITIETTEDPVLRVVLTDTPTGINREENREAVVATRYYNLQGIEIAQPQAGKVYVVKKIYESGKNEVNKVLNK